MSGGSLRLGCGGNGDRLATTRTPSIVPNAKTKQMSFFTLKSLLEFDDIPYMENVRIENWELVYTQNNPYQAPECRQSVLCGQVYGHPDFDDGESIMTSTIMDTNGVYVKTHSHIYILGKVSDKYAEWCKKHSPHADLVKPFPEKDGWEK